MSEKKTKDKKPKDKKETLSLKRTIANSIFALKMAHSARPGFIFLNMFQGAVNAGVSFLTGSYMLRVIVNNIQQHAPYSKTVNFLAVVAVCYLVNMMLTRWFWDIRSNRDLMKIRLYIENILYQKSAEVELACYEDPEYYNKHVKAVEDANWKLMQPIYNINYLLSELLTFAANTVLLFTIDPSLMIFALIPVLLGIVKNKSQKLDYDYYMEAKEINRKHDYVKRTFYMGQYAGEMRLSNMYRCMFRQQKEAYLTHRTLLKKYGFRRAAAGYILDVGQSVITVLGATVYALYRATVSKTMLYGDCIVVLNSINSVSYNLSEIVTDISRVYEDALYIENVRKFLEYEPKIVKNENGKIATGGEIEIKNLSFRYEGASENTLKSINMYIKPGEKIALVGRNGSGKTTLIKLLMYLYEPTEGSISLEKTDMHEYTLSSYRNLFSTVFQDYHNFSMTVAENVLMKKVGEGDREIVVNALRESGMYERIAKTENGIDTILTREFDDKGEVLSGGEAQKISLARVFASQSPIVILDEPSSALDPIAEYKMFENMMRACENRSVIFISHRMSSAPLADRIYMMCDGEIAESGSHKELMEMGGKYAEMFTKQAHNYLD